jgi:hypothetical protein
MSHRLYVTITAILTFASGAPALYPGDCVPTPGGPVVTARVVQKLSNDPPQFEVEFEACKVTAAMGARERCGDSTDCDYRSHGQTTSSRSFPFNALNHARQ